MNGVLTGLEKRDFMRIDGAGRQFISSLVAIEEPLQIIVNDKSVAVLMRTPGNEKELAVGFCISEGLIDSFEEIALVQHCGSLAADPDRPTDALDTSRNQVTITTLDRGASRNDPRLDVLRLVRSGCGRTEPAEMVSTLRPLTDDLRVDKDIITGLSHKMINSQMAYREAGGIHAVAIFDRHGELVVTGEDVGRHNAIDKTLGYCLLRGIPLHDKIIYSTGRASYEMVLKSIRVGIPIAISRSSATTLAIDLAEPLDCTLIGYARAGKMSIYAHPERIVGD